MRPTLFVFAKEPRMGAAKTRLARDIGPAHAQRHYRAMTAQILRRVQDPRWDTIIYATPPHAITLVPEWRGQETLAQPGGSLTDRLALVFKRPGPICVIGSDCPYVDARDIATAFRSLRGQDAVFGPAVDGGFWLMAARGPLRPGTFVGVRWSHEETFADIAARFDKLTTLRALEDIDDGPSLKRFIQSRPIARSAVSTSHRPKTD